ncbi:MAG: T9SS type A sorting domain-containing protein [Bacteroidia bacterium]|nr:T9SS type A sorting domain-containing protein [Bacteroidia bacterium]
MTLSFLELNLHAIAAIIMKPKLKIKLLLIIFLSPIYLFATHIIGGMMELNWIEGDNYQLNVRVIRDCNSGSPNAYFDNTISVGIFEKGTDSLISNFILSFSKSNDDTLKIEGICAKKYSICSQIGTYSKIIILDSAVFNSENGYYLSSQRCCRNGSISNIINPGDAGFCIYAEVPKSQIRNRTPHYTNKPFLLVNKSFPFTFNLGIIDEDKDSLKYSFVTPLNGLLDKNNPYSINPMAGPYPLVGFGMGYSLGNLLGSTQPLRIDSTTGLISGLPDKEGRFLVCILVEEFRAGKKIGEVRLELEIYVFSSSKPAPTMLFTDASNTEVLGDSITMHTPDLFSFTALGSTSSDSIFLEIEIPDSLVSKFPTKPIYSTLTFGKKNCSSKFQWQTYCGMDSILTKIPIKIIAYDNDCPVPMKNSKTVWLNISNLPELKGPSGVCMGAQNVEFSLPENLSSNSYVWTLPFQILGSSNSNKINTSIANSIFNGEISVYGKNTCGANVRVVHPVASTSKPNKPVLSLWGASIYSSSQVANQWFRNDTLIIGANKNYYEIKSNGRYHAIVNWNGCKSDPSSAIDIDFIYNGGAEIEANIEFQVYPNPFSNSLSIDYSGADKNAQYSLFASDGMLLETGILFQKTYLKTDDFSSGVYFLHFQTNKGNYHLKVIKE